MPPSKIRIPRRSSMTSRGSIHHFLLCLRNPQNSLNMLGRRCLASCSRSSSRSCEGLSGILRLRSGQDWSKCRLRPSGGWRRIQYVGAVGSNFRRSGSGRHSRSGTGTRSGCLLAQLGHRVEQFPILDAVSDTSQSYGSPQLAGCRVEDVPVTSCATRCYGRNRQSLRQQFFRN